MYQAGFKSVFIASYSCSRHVITSLRNSICVRSCAKRVWVQESSALADKLIDRQVYLALEAEHSVNIKHDLLALRELNAEAHRRLEQAYETIRELTSSRAREGAGIVDAQIQVDDRGMIEHIHALQHDLLDLRARDQEHQAARRDLAARLHELETVLALLCQDASQHAFARRPTSGCARRRPTTAWPRSRSSSSR